VELPPSIRDIDHLEQLLSEPSQAAIDAVRRVAGDIVVLGVAGKMGPTLARMARRALDAAGVAGRVIGVARFSTPGQQEALEAHGIQTLRCDLLNEDALSQLPDAPNVIYMAGRKFGSTGDESYTWAMNTYLPALVCRRYPTSRIVAFSTGNVYGLTPKGRGGSREEDPPAPIGDYAISCLGRERIFEYFSRSRGLPTAILRLNYASEMRYGVLTDLAGRIFRREPVDVTMGYFNVIWQADANAMALAALAHTESPPLILNLAGPEELSARAASTELARLMGIDVRFTGAEAQDALLSNGARARALFGEPRVDAARLLTWTADWTLRGGESLGKPTHFESRSGRFLCPSVERSSERKASMLAMRKTVLAALQEGKVIPAHPLALDSTGRLDERRQRALTRYYVAAGAGGVAVGVHTTQFAIRDPKVGLFEPVLSIAREELDRADARRPEPVIRIGGVCGKTDQALGEADLLVRLGYHAALLSLAALKDADDGALIDHCKCVAARIPLVGFYLQPSVGGRVLSYAFWRRFAEIPEVIAIKIAPFNRYQTLDVVRAVIDAGRDDIALYTGNDDAIVIDLVTTFRLMRDGNAVERRIVGGLLGHWAVWTQGAVALLRECQAAAIADHVPASLLARGVETTDANSAFFDAAHGFAGCIAGIQEVLRRQGLLISTRCLDAHETLSPGQASEIDRVYRAYPHLADDRFVAANLEEWMAC
jgi:nucleoside-diphosphate-sugar epimerase